MEQMCKLVMELPYSCDVCVLRKVERRSAHNDRWEEVVCCATGETIKEYMTSRGYQCPLIYDDK